MSKLNKRLKMLRAAARAPAGIRDAAASKWSRVKQRRHNDSKLGTFGAASTVRVIVKDGKHLDASKACADQHTANVDEVQARDDEQTKISGEIQCFLIR